MGGFWESRGKVAGLNTQRRTLFILYSITIIFITYSKVTNKNLSKLESPKSKSKSYEAAQKGKKLGGAELWEIEGGYQNLTKSSNGSRETLMPQKGF